MILTVDIGNTQTVIGVFSNHQLQLHGRFSSRRDWTIDEFATLIQQWLQSKLTELKQIEGIAIGSVVPPLEHIVRDALRSLLPHARCLSVGPGIKTGVPIRYENPKEVGADRIVNAAAAYEQFKTALIVVDFGTAITFDCVDKAGNYLGGAISPGIHVSMEALVRNTAKLPRIDPEPPKNVIGRTTVESLSSGIFWGFTELVRGMIGRIGKEMGPVKVIATGGWAETIGPQIPEVDVIDPWLTLKGLDIIYHRNF